MAIVLNGQISIQQQRHALAASGKYFVASNPTEATGIQYGTSAAYSATANGLFSVSNSNSVGGASIYLDYISLQSIGTAPTATTSMRFGVYSETGVVALTSAAAARTPVNVNSAFPNNTGAVVTSYAAGSGTVAAAAGTRRFLGSATIPTSLGVTGDEYVLQFGGDSIGSGAYAVVVRATVPTRFVATVPPVVVAPGNSVYVNMYWLTQATTAPTFEFVLAYAEI